MNRAAAAGRRLAGVPCRLLRRAARWLLRPEMRLREPFPFFEPDDLGVIAGDGGSSDEPGDDMGLFAVILPERS